MNEIVIYKTPDEQTAIEVKFDGDTVWLNQHQIALLFQRYRTVIFKHINNVFKEGELDDKLVFAIFAHTSFCCQKLFIN